MRKLVDFDIPSISLFKALKSLDSKTFETPAEVGAAPLSLTLDLALAQNTSWSLDSERHSKALELAGAVYRAVLETAEVAEARVLVERWSAARQVDLIDQLVRALGGSARLSVKDRAEVLRRQSLTRTRIRLRPFGLAEETQQRVVESMPTLNSPPDPGELLLLVGEFGSGKSELAESWFRSNIDDFVSAPDSATPVWLSAHEATHTTIEQLVQGRVGEASLEGRGIRLVVDGLDEQGAQVAMRVFNEALVLVEVFPKSSVLLTARPGLFPSSAEQRPTEPLSEDSALSLIEVISGARPYTGTWSKALRQAVRRPFFALAAATLLTEGARPAGEIDIIAGVVERALSVPFSAASATPPRDLAALLQRIALARTNGEQLVVGFLDETEAVRSGLVVKGAEGVLTFALPIFQQWFAAQYLLENPATFELGLQTPAAFDAWRWTLSIALIRAPSEQFDSWMRRAFEINPGASSWLLDRLRPGIEARRTSDTPIDETAAMRRLLFATRSWIDGIGSLAPKVLPVNGAASPLGIGVRVTGKYVNLAWRTEPSLADSVEVLPDQTTVISHQGTEWNWRSSTRVAEGPEWPWHLIQKRIAGATLHVLESDEMLGPLFGVWHQESMYRAARCLINDRTVRHLPMSRDEVLAAGERLLAAIAEPDVDGTFIDFRPTKVRASIVRDLVQMLQESPGDTVPRPTPGPDLDPFNNSPTYPLRFYSPRAQLGFQAEVFGLAVSAYEEAVVEVFSRFGWSLGGWARAPFGVVVEVTPDIESWGDLETNAVGYTRVPLDALDALAARLDAPIASSNGRALAFSNIDRNSQILRDLYEELVRPSDVLLANPFATSAISQSIEDRSLSLRPVSGHVADWIWDDLGNLGLADGTFPRLD